MDPGEIEQKPPVEAPQSTTAPPEMLLETSETTVSAVSPSPPPITAPDPAPPVMLESPFMSEPEVAERSPTPKGPLADPNLTPIPRTRGTFFPRFAPLPERQGTARPREYRRAPRMDEAVHDQKLSEMGSIRMGTSALISALSALPLEADESSISSDEEVETKSLPPHRPKISRMHSSLLTLRPMAPATEGELYSTRSQPATSRSPPRDNHSPLRSARSPPDSPESRHHKLTFPYKENVISRRARAPSITELKYQHAPASPELAREDLLGPGRITCTETLREIATGTAEVSEPVEEIEGSAIGRPERGHLAVESESTPQMLQSVFGLADQEELIEEMHCWLLRTEMLQGYMYLTRRHICFFAKVSQTENDKTIKSGPLWKKASRTKMSTRFWVTLRNDVLSWYDSPNDPYFPKGNVSLQYALNCDLVDETRFKVRLPERHYNFQSDTPANAQEWVRVIQKSIVKLQNEGQGVKLIIPWEAVYEVERSPTLEFAETIEIKVVDSEDAMSLDSYFFASFPDNDYAYDLLQTLLRERPVSELPPPAAPRPKPTDQKRDSRSRFSLTNLSSALPIHIPKFASDKRDADHDRVPIAPPTVLDLPQSGTESVVNHSEPNSEMSEDDEAKPRIKGYPPRPSGPTPPGMVSTPSGWAATDWIRRGSAQLFGPSPGSRLPPPRRRVTRRGSVTEVVEGYAFESTDESDSEPARSRTRHSIPRLMSTATELSLPTQEDSVAKQFRKTFALPEKEILLDHMSGSLYRVLPVSGRFFVSTNYFCFRSSGLLSKTKMIVPIRQLYGMKAQKAFRFGHHALIVIIKGYEELFLEFHSADRRDELMTLLEERMDDVREAGQAIKAIETTLGETAALTDDMGGSVQADAAIGSMFDSATSSFLQFKPEPMTIVCLTIGSRGDVQPYIALCKGLQAEGHTCRIATHAEYQAWVEGHGIGFAPVGGDPAKLMELCVDNGMFTISFLKEGLQMFRGWLDELLNESWLACQGADLLIESPSAMAGIHIADALRIPYYRAFTMPWTRTRAYPQAFAVPEHKRGGSYNYMTYVMFDNVFWRAIAGQVNHWRKNVLKIDATTFDKMAQDKVPFLYNFSPSVVPPPMDWTEWIHVCGYWFLDNADGKKDWTPPDGIVDFIENAHARGKKVVYIGFGSIVVSDPQEMTRCVVQGVMDSGVCAILSKGWSDRGSRGKTNHSEVGDSIADGADGVELPPEIFSVDAIDHSWLFPRIDAACHHGGAGTTAASLRAGIPTIIKPFFGDQFFWAERVESLGVGTGLRQLTYEGLARALVEATTNERQIAKAKIVGQTIRAEDGVQRAIEAIYRDLEYARSLIPHEEDPYSIRAGLPLTLSRTPSRQDSSHTPSRSGSHTHSRTSSLGDILTHSHSRTRSTEGMRSDGSWSVVSDGGASHSDSDEHHHRVPVLGSLVGHISSAINRAETRK
ncbi:uncharacterized protein CcaverHIS019_0505720 [Cutaneotrichosporon cavernicola]|uniref:sterol 3beta-glucosyltransferase n=1 Tax=Cutaneotrichosporon cavernicola TaxID=279322 RepID=A0AA48L6L4_9TREE|nr:uncharacterized protein CcaverHIS019_0505720 [Cutaneotrichosporon cavernicola]BEI92944.1 hypothetical protein CcaverHIS019_0505720 [Cutaneotrichosporon cavernicola]BEJ00720.1 hypothetical protein CcaverHIS631_0505770 [Cutaneotrichosporon cavernicola]BEJ08487.1 hypothetical protein CcaverHIS641_0505810 [Cutaneotrichosporon cavernicola]